MKTLAMGGLSCTLALTWGLTSHSANVSSSADVHPGKNASPSGSSGSNAGAPLSPNAGAVRSVGSGSTTSDKPEFQLDVRTPKAVGLIYFIQSLAGESHHNEMTVNFFHHYREETAEDKKALDDYRASVEGESLIAGERNLETGIEMLASMSTSVDTFLDSAEAILTVEQYSKLASAVRHFEPFYTSQIYSMYTNNLRMEQKALISEATRVGFTAKLRDVATILQSDWPANCKFTAVLASIPLMTAHHYSSYGHSNGPVVFLESVAMDIPNSLGIMFHEFCHSLWQQRSDQTKRALIETFAHANGMNAYNVLNEAFACALGNGYMVECASGTLPKKNWYDNDYIEKFAHAIYPLTIEYLKAGKPLDQEYATKTTAMFDGLFPQAHLDPQLALWNVVGIIGDGSADVHEKMPAMTHSTSMCLINDLWSAEKTLSQSPDASLLVLCRDNQLSQVTPQFLDPASVASVRALWKKDRSRPWCKFDGVRWLLVCLGETPQEQVDKFSSIVHASQLPVVDEQPGSTQSK